MVAERERLFYTQKAWNGKLLRGADNFHQYHYLQAYFQGWELYQNTNALVVIYENSGTVTMHTYGSLSEYYRLYLLVFSATSENLYLSLLLQGTSPAPELAQLLLNNHIPRSFPPQLVPYATLLTILPTLPPHPLATPQSTSPLAKTSPVSNYLTPC